MDEGTEQQNKMGIHTVDTDTRTFANKIPGTFSKKYKPKENVEKACITTPTENNTDKEKRRS